MQKWILENNADLILPKIEIIKYKDITSIKTIIELQNCAVLGIITYYEKMQLEKYEFDKYIEVTEDKVEDVWKLWMSPGRVKVRQQFYLARLFVMHGDKWAESIKEDDDYYSLRLMDYERIKLADKVLEILKIKVGELREENTVSPEIYRELYKYINENKEDIRANLCIRERNNGNIELKTINKILSQILAVRLEPKRKSYKEKNKVNKKIEYFSIKIAECWNWIKSQRIILKDTDNKDSHMSIYPNT